MLHNRFIRTDNINIRRYYRLICRYTNAAYTKAIRALFQDQLRVHSFHVLTAGFSSRIDLQVFLISNFNFNSSFLGRKRIRTIYRNGAT